MKEDAKSVLDIPVVVDTAPFPLDPYMSTGLLDTEELLPEDNEGGSSKPSFEPNAAAMGQLEGMGFPAPRCIRALYNTGNSDAETAMNWLFQHMDDPDIDAPLELPRASTGAAGAQADPESVVMLTSMGFTEAQAKKALRETGGDVERAVEWVFSHPDDAGDPEGGPTGGASEAPAEKTVSGSTETPANFQLHSIVCHKGSSIHSG